MRPGPRSARVVAIVSGIAFGTATVFAAGALGNDPAPIATRPADPPSEPPPNSEAAPSKDPIVMLVWSPQGLPPDLQRRVGRVKGVNQTTIVRARLSWLHRTRTSDGVLVDSNGPGRAIPFELAGIDPAEFSSFVLPAERAAVAGLGAGEILLSQSESSLRNAGEGLVMKFEDSQRTVAGVVSDESASGYEGLVPLDEFPEPAEAEEFMLLVVDSSDRRAVVERHLRKWLGDRPYRTRLQGEVPYLRYGDAVLPQLIVKRHFGEFWVTPDPDATVTIDPEWREANVVTRRLPLIGPVACHRAIVPQLSDALAEIAAQGLAFAVDRGQWSGCFGPRFINRDPNGRLSHHTWAIAIDINVSSNPYGSQPHQDRRIVQIFEEHGFTWGGRWLVPDGMHFEWVSPG